MINLNASVIVFYRKDCEDREINLNTLLKFYHKHYENFEFIIAEQKNNDLPFDISSFSNTKHILLPELTDTWNKMKGYNEAVKDSFYENLIFNDTDVIFSPEGIRETLEILSKDNKKVILPSDGHFICVKQKVRDEFIQNLDYEFLCDLIDVNHYNQLNFENDKIRVGHTRSPGGGFITKKRNIFNCNGFNPNFLGWGYEDNETLCRFDKMGFSVCRLNTKFCPLFHLDHEGSERETNPYYKQNNNLVNFVEKIDSKLLFLYSNTWKM